VAVYRGCDDHALAETMDERSPDTIVLCRPAAPYFCVGYHRVPAQELDLGRHLATLNGLLRPHPSEAEVRRRLIREYETGLGRPLARGGLTGLEEAAVVTREERRLARLPDAGGGGLGDAPLKLTRRVSVHEWMGPVGGDEVTVTARITDGRIEELVVAGQALDRTEAEPRVLEALGAGTRQ
jgi:hypothetical protein